MTDGTRIVSLRVENFMRLSAVLIEPKGNLVEITGKNRAGKSSVLNAIWAALEVATAIHAEPIRKGANEALIQVDLGTLKVTRKFKRRDDGSSPDSIVVENAEGQKLASPQKTISALIGALTFDPMAFMGMKPREQFEALRIFVPEVDFEAVEKANKEDYDRRTDVNRDEKRLRAQIAGIVIPAEVPVNRVNETALVQKLEAAGRDAASIAEARAERERREREAAFLEESAVGFRAEAEKMLRKAEEAERAAVEERAALAALDPLPEPADTTAIRDAIEAARENNRLFDAAAAARINVAVMTEEADRLKAKSDRLTRALDRRKEQVETEIAAAEMPVPGLSFGDGAVLLNGLPLEQASAAEQIQVSVAIAAAANPKLKVAFVKDGSLLDEDSWATLAATADRYGCQIWVETVASDRPGAIVIEDGHVSGGAQ